MNYRFTIPLGLALAISAPLRAQHTGHPQPETNQTVAVDLGQAMKESHALLRKVERALKPSALENAMLPLVVTKLGASEKRTRALEALQGVGLGDKSQRLPGELSGCEQGRVAIARALVNDPPLILADEPTGNLDSKTGGEIIQLLRSLNKQGPTILMVTHNLEAAAAAHRILKIRDGSLEEKT